MQIQQLSDLPEPLEKTSNSDQLRKLAAQRNCIRELWRREMTESPCWAKKPLLMPQPFLAGWLEKSRDQSLENEEEKKLQSPPLDD